MLLSRLVLCLSLLAATAGLAQASEGSPPAGTAPADDTVPPLLTPAGESPEQPAPRGEVFPREQEDDEGGDVRFAGRLLLQPPAGILVGGLAALVSFYPVSVSSLVLCDAISRCSKYLFVSGIALGTSIGAGLGVATIGHLLGGRGRFGATIGGALAGFVLAGTIASLTRQEDLMTVSAFLLVGSALGATLVYALSEAFFPDPTRAVTPAKKDTDEYVRLLPMVGPTRTGGIIGSLVGQF